MCERVREKQALKGEGVIKKTGIEQKEGKDGSVEIPDIPRLPIAASFRD